MFLLGDLPGGLHGITFEPLVQQRQTAYCLENRKRTISSNHAIYVENTKIKIFLNVLHRIFLQLCFGCVMLRLRVLR